MKGLKQLAVGVALTAALVAPVWAASPNNMRAQGAALTSNGSNGTWSMGGGPVQLNGSSKGLTFHYLDSQGVVDMTCDFTAPDAIKLTNTQTPNLITFTPTLCWTTNDPENSWTPSNAEIVFTASSLDGGATYSAQASWIYLPAPNCNLTHFNGTAGINPQP